VQILDLEVCWAGCFARGLKWLSWIAVSAQVSCTLSSALARVQRSLVVEDSGMWRILVLTRSEDHLMSGLLRILVFLGWA